FTVPSRRRQKKGDNKVAELEKKIDALTQSLLAVRHGRAHSPVDDGSESPDDGDSHEMQWEPAPQHSNERPPAQKRYRADSGDEKDKIVREVHVQGKSSAGPPGMEALAMRYPFLAPRP